MNSVHVVDGSSSRFHDEVMNSVTMCAAATLKAMRLQRLTGGDKYAYAARCGALKVITIKELCRSIYVNGINNYK